MFESKPSQDEEYERLRQEEKENKERKQEIGELREFIAGLESSSHAVKISKRMEDSKIEYDIPEIDEHPDVMLYNALLDRLEELEEEDKE